MEREIFSGLTEGLPYVGNCNTAYLVLLSYRSITYSVQTFPPPLKISSIISHLIYFSIDFPPWKVLPYAFISGQSCSARETKHNGSFPFDQIFRFEIPGIPWDEWNSIFRFVAGLRAKIRTFGNIPEHGIIIIIMRKICKIKFLTIK